MLFKLENFFTTKIAYTEPNSVPSFTVIKKICAGIKKNQILIIHETIMFVAQIN